jgi:hypothetical protein
MKLDITASIAEAKTKLYDELRSGAICPCCHQFVKMYKRKLNSGMALTLLRIHYHHKTEWVQVKSFLRIHQYTNSHDWTLLRFWGLMEEYDQDPEDESKKSNGIWKVTPMGIDFIERRIRVKSHILTYNGRCYGMEGKEIDILDALGKKNQFHYQELMQS